MALPNRKARVRTAVYIVVGLNSSEINTRVEALDEDKMVRVGSEV
jgi:hypothetical protein